MRLPTIERLGSELAELDPSQPEYASRAVDAALAAAESAGASDVHLQPAPQGLELKFRVDGVLLAVAPFPATWLATWSPGSRSWPSCSPTVPTSAGRPHSPAGGRGGDAA